MYFSRYRKCIKLKRQINEILYHPASLKKLVTSTSTGIPDYTLLPSPVLTFNNKYFDLCRRREKYLGIPSNGYKCLQKIYFIIT